jgi:hypothetical protein
MEQMIYTWLGSSLVTTLGLAAAAWLARNWIIARLKTSVEHEFNQKLERLRSELRTSEDALRDVRSTALHALAAKETARDKRRIEGIETIWGAMLELKKFYGTAATLQVLNYDAISDHVDDAKMRQYFGVTFAGVDASKPDDPKILQADAARPWVSPMIWALFKAYWAAIGYARAIAGMLKIGEDPRKFTSPEKIDEFLSAALPEEMEQFRPFRPLFIAPMLDLLELRLLAAIRKELADPEPDITTVQQAQRIADAASQIGSVTEERRN